MFLSTYILVYQTFANLSNVGNLNLSVSIEDMCQGTETKDNSDKGKGKRGNDVEESVATEWSRSVIKPIPLSRTCFLLVMQSYQIIAPAILIPDGLNYSRRDTQ